MSYAFTAAAPITPFPRAARRPAARKAGLSWQDHLAIAYDAAGLAIILGLAAAPTAFTIAVTLNAFGLRIL